MNRKIKLLVIIFVLMFLLIGWGEKKVELLDNNRLINLDKAIEYAKPGGAWKQNESGLSDTPENDSEDIEPEKDDNQEDMEDGNSNIKYITVSDETITYCGIVIAQDELLELLIRDNGESVSFILVDDWAEAHVYRVVRKILNDAKTSAKINFSEER